MAKKQIAPDLEIVKMSNALARARWHVESVYEPRLVALVASRVRMDDTDFYDYEIQIKELIGTAADGRTYKLVADVVDGLLGRIVTMTKEHGGFAKCTIFSYCEYDPEKGIIKAHFDPAMKPHYLELKKRFTEYNLLEFMALPSVYSQRIFEILKSWQDQPEVTIAIVELYEMLNVPDSLRKDFKDFRRRVLEKAHSDITERTSFHYTWEAVKKGKAVTAVTFRFNAKSQSSKSQPAQPAPQPEVPEVVPDPPRGAVDTQALECELKSLGIHKKTAADYAARADQAGKASSILNRLPGIIERANGQPTAARQRYILGAIQGELQQQQQIEVPATSLNIEAEAKKCWQEKQTAKTICPIRKYQEAGGRARCEICLQTIPVGTSGV